MMEIRLEGNTVLNEVDCVVCGEEMQLVPVAAVAYINGERLGDVCFGCIRGGPLHMQKRVAKNAEGVSEKTIGDRGYIRSVSKTI